MRLAPQSYGIATAQTTFGGPRGIWLECTRCNCSDRIVDAPASMSDQRAAEAFRIGGWTGVGDRMLKAKCPACTGARKE